VDLTDFDFSLRWPRELFLWEARRIATQRRSSSFINMVVCLFSEAFVDGDIAGSVEQLSSTSGSWFTPVATPNSDADNLLDALLKNPSLAHAYEPPTYWLERQSGPSRAGLRKSLARAYVELIDEMREVDYFPKVLPKGCVDDGSTWQEFLDHASSEISRAIRTDVRWPIDDSALSIPDDVLYSVIEYLHDQAQRPRTRGFHSYADCGWHYGDHNKESGGVVYRWRVNELLDRYDVGLRLGSKGAEKGRLVRHSRFDLDDLAEELTEVSSEGHGGKVASAIRLYRARASTVHDRRAAVAQLAGILESARQTLKSGEFAKGDESALFNIFNNFAIRHDNERQQGAYGDEYLDWIFWTTLAAVQLLGELERRTS